MSKEELRRRFNEGRYWERAQNGELLEKVEEEGSPSPRVPLPPGTLSQTIAYWDREGRRIAVVHQYLRPDGSLGASGRPDPKCLLEGGTLYAPHLRPPP